MALLSISKASATKPYINEALLALGTASHVWFEDAEDKASRSESKDLTGWSLLQKSFIKA